MAHHIIARADGENPSVPDGDRLRGRLPVVDGDDHSVGVDGVRLLRKCGLAFSLSRLRTHYGPPDIFCRAFRSLVIHNPSSIFPPRIFLQAKPGTGKWGQENYSLTNLLSLRRPSPPAP